MLRFRSSVLYKNNAAVGDEWERQQATWGRTRLRLHLDFVLVLFFLISMLSLLQEKTVLLNSQYIEYSPVIQHVADRLLRDVELLDMPPIDLAHAKDFVRDHGKQSLFAKQLRF